MRHASSYLDWYINVPRLRFDLRSSGLMHFNYNLNLGPVDLSANYAFGNPRTTRLLATRYKVNPANVFLSSEGASGQNARIIRYLAEHDDDRTEAIVEYPTYEPLLRQVQEYFPTVTRLRRQEKEAYRLDPTVLRKSVTRRTGLVVLTNPHAPSGAITRKQEMVEIMEVAREHDLPVLCDEIYAEFNREMISTAFSVDPDHGIVTTSFTKAYGLGGLKLGTTLATEKLVLGLYNDVLNTVGNSSNTLQVIAADLLANGRHALDMHKQRWAKMRIETEEWLDEENLQYFPNKIGVTYWVDLAIADTYKWTSELTIPRYQLATVPGAFFLFGNNRELTKSTKARIGLGTLNPENPELTMALDALKQAIAHSK